VCNLRYWQESRSAEILLENRDLEHICGRTPPLFPVTYLTETVVRLRKKANHLVEKVCTGVSHHRCEDYFSPCRPQPGLSRIHVATKTLDLYILVKDSLLKSKET
jgi:hypothetical protein